MKRAVKLLVFVLCVGFTIASIVNVFSDNTEVEQMAKGVACEAAPAKPAATMAPTVKPAAAKPAAASPGAECRMTMTKTSRTPFGQSFEYTGSSTTRRIRCVRSLIFLGEYVCAAE